MVSVEHAARLLGLALADLAIVTDQRKLVSALNQAVSQSGDAASWADWFVIACPAVGLRCRRLTMGRDEVEELARAGGVILIRPAGEWVTVSAAGAVQVRNIDANGQLRGDRALSQYLPEESLEAVIVEGGFPQNHGDHPHPSPWQRLIQLLSPEWPDVFTILIYSLVIAILTLATPLAVESLVNTVAFGRLVQPIVVLSAILFGFLAFSAMLRALQTFVAEIVQRRLFARVASDLAWRLARVHHSSVDGRNMPELVNRFFDVVTVQKVVSQFLLDGISVVLSTLIGMTVLAFYHPMLLAFDLVLIVAIAFILFVLGYGAIGTSIKESKFKYSTAERLEEIARCPLLFKGVGGAEYALHQMDAQVAGYLDARKKHFRVLLRQTLSALMLQALASTALLAMGGWLVIVGQLTLGQLVAAELIVTVIVSSVAKFGKHLEAFYDLMASIDKLGYLFDLPVESYEGAVAVPADRPFELIVGEASSQSASSSGWKLGLGESVAILGSDHSTRRLIDQLYGLQTSESGAIRIADVALRDIRPDLLRRDVSLVRSREVLDGTIADNIVVGRSEISHDEVWAAIRAVGLEQRVNSLPQGIRCPLSVDGSPLERGEVIRLVLARALASRPRLLLIDGALDALSDAEIESLLGNTIFRDPQRAVLLVSGRQLLRAACDRQVPLIEA